MEWDSSDEWDVARVLEEMGQMVASSFNRNSVILEITLRENLIKYNKAMMEDQRTINISCCLLVNTIYVHNGLDVTIGVGTSEGIESQTMACGEIPFPFPETHITIQRSPSMDLADQQIPTAGKNAKLV